MAYTLEQLGTRFVKNVILGLSSYAANGLLEILK